MIPKLKLQIELDIFIINRLKPDIQQGPTFHFKIINKLTLKLNCDLTKQIGLVFDFKFRQPKRKQHTRGPHYLLSNFNLKLIILIYKIPASPSFKHCFRDVDGRKEFCICKSTIFLFSLEVQRPPSPIHMPQSRCRRKSYIFKSIPEL